MLRIKSIALLMVGKCSTTELHPQPDNKEISWLSQKTCICLMKLDFDCALKKIQTTYGFLCYAGECLFWNLFLFYVEDTNNGY